MFLFRHILTEANYAIQVPQYLLDEAIFAGRGGCTSVICTQPRRIAAISVAERVCQERGQTPPGNLPFPTFRLEFLSASNLQADHSP